MSTTRESLAERNVLSDWRTVAMLFAVVVGPAGRALIADEPASTPRPPLGGAVARARACVLKVECMEQSSLRGVPSILSAVAFDDNGHLLTVGLREPLERALCVRDCSGKRHEARWVAADEQSGLTLLKAEPGIVRVPEMVDSMPEIGSPALVVGNPFGMSHSVSIGNISGLDRTVSLPGGVGRRMIQFTAPIFPGDSGGLLADSEGRMLGIVSTSLTEPNADRGPGRSTGVGLAIPVSELRTIAFRLREGQPMERGYLGVTVEDAEPSGVRVIALAEGSPAETAGLRVDDVIVSLDGTELKDFDDLATRIDRLRPGDEVQLKTTRQGEEITIAVRLGERRDAVRAPRRRIGRSWPELLDRLDQLDEARGRGEMELAWPNAHAFVTDGAFLGVHTQRVTEALAKKLSISSNEGAIVNSVLPGSPADRAGLRASDVILKLDDQAVTSPGVLRELIRKAGPGATVRLQFIRDGAQHELDATLAQAPYGFWPDDRFGPRSPRTIPFDDQTARRLESLEERVRHLEKKVEALQQLIEGSSARPVPSPAGKPEREPE